MERYTNYNQKSARQIAEESDRLIGEKYGGTRTVEAEADVRRLEGGEPVDYVIGQTDFLGAKIDLSLRPLIPRSGVERWLSEALETIKKSKASGQVRCLDMFSGSGCVGIAALLHLPDASVDFADIDGKALEQIKINLKLNSITEERARVIKSDIWEGISGEYDYIFANPPYIPLSARDRVAASSIKYEPSRALFAGDDGMSCIAPFLGGIKYFLRPGGRAWMEHFFSEQAEIEKILASVGYKRFTFSEYEDDPQCLILESGAPPGGLERSIALMLFRLENFLGLRQNGLIRRFLSGGGKV